MKNMQSATLYANSGSCDYNECVIAHSIYIRYLTIIRRRGSEYR